MPRDVATKQDANTRPYLLSFPFPLLPVARTKITNWSHFHEQSKLTNKSARIGNAVRSMKSGTKGSGRSWTSCRRRKRPRRKRQSGCEICPPKKTRWAAASVIPEDRLSQFLRRVSLVRRTTARQLRGSVSPFHLPWNGSSDRSISCAGRMRQGGCAEIAHATGECVVASVVPRGKPLGRNSALPPDGRF